ncbi:MAG: hypothetical protein AABX79_03265 [Nanoarchaeota archaeon]
MEESDSDIFRTSKDRERARDLFEMAKERSDIIIASIPKSVPYKLLEEYYEISVQLMTSLMYLEGYKTLSHIALIRFLSKFEFNVKEIEILDKMRKFRHGTVYYGRKESGNFYINHQEEIKKTVDKLFSCIKRRLEVKRTNERG